MNKLISLLKIEVLNLYGLNRLFQFKDKQKRKNSLIFMACALGLGLLLVYTSGTYSFGMILGLQAMELEHIFPSLLLIVAVFFLFTTTILKVQGVLFGYKDYDMLMSLPISTKLIVISKVGVLYFMNLVTALLILIPGSVVYGVVTEKGGMYYFCTLIAIIFVPIVPIVLASILGAIISYISTFFRKMRIAQYLLTTILIIGFYIVNLNGNPDINLDKIELTIDRIYPLSSLYRLGVNSGEIHNIIFFIAISMLFMLIFVVVLSWKYTKINTSLSGVRTRSNYKIGSLQEATVQKAILKRELKRYFASPFYVFNTLAMPIMFLIFAIAVTFFNHQTIEVMQEIMPIDAIRSFIPFLGAIFAITTCTTSSSISLEGKKLWISKVLPIEPKEIFKGKIGLNLIVVLPITFLGNIFLAIRFEQNIYEIFLTMLMSLTYALFISHIGLICNLKWPRFDWKTETQVIKRGFATTISVFIGLITGIGSLLGTIRLSDLISTHIMVMCISIIMLCLCFFMNRWLHRKGSKIWYTL